MAAFVFDTTVLIDHLRGHRPALNFIKKVESGEMVGKISTLSITELYAGRNSRAEKKKDLIIRLLSLMEKIHVDEVVAERAGAIRREHGTRTTDAIIAATSMLSDSVLLTSNLKDFERIPGLNVKAPY